LRTLIIGAGPFGLALSAYARAHGIEHTVVGRHMDFWKQHMPGEMLLRSRCDWHLDPLEEHTIEHYLETLGLQPADVEPLSLKFYLDYCDWFTKEKEIEIDDSRVDRLDIGENGSRTGPNLSEIGDKRSAEQLKTSITDPDAEVLPENRFVAVTLKDGSTVRGRILNHDAMSVQLIDDKQNLRSFLTANIRGYTILTKGLMPKPNLTDEQVSDVVAYLSSLKGPEAP